MTSIPHLGQINAVPIALALDAAGVDPATHDNLPWHMREDIAAARADGRIVARYVVRYGDPECYIVRRG